MTNPRSIVQKASVNKGGVVGISAAGVFDPTEFSAKTAPVAADKVVIQDTEDTNAPKGVTFANVCKAIGPTQAGTVTATGLANSSGVLTVAVHSMTAKTAPVAADEIPIADTEASNVLKKMTITKAAIPLGTIHAGVEATNGLTVDANGVLTVAAKIAHLEAALLTRERDFPVSFETGFQMTLKVYFPEKVTINKVLGIVTKAIAGSDNATVTCGNSTGASTGGVMTFVAADALGTEKSATPSTNNVVAANSYYYLTMAKSTAGGEALITLEYTVTA